MKKRYSLAALAALAVSLPLWALMPVEEKQKDGSVVINTTELCEARGYRGATPLEVTVKKGKIVKVVALPNHETPRYFAKLANADFFSRWNGVSVKKVATMEVDAVTGATYSCKAVEKNVKAAAAYAAKMKK